MKPKTLKILIVEDDLLSRLSLKSRLDYIGEVREASSKEEALLLIENNQFDLAFVDLDLESQLAGLDIVARLSEKKTYTVVLSGREDERVIENAYLQGCRDYLSKPFTKTSLELIFKKYNSVINKNKTLQKLKDIFLTDDSSLVKELEIIEQALLGQRPILITGESGTGKTFLAKFIHQLSDEVSGKKSAFVHLNCAEISESLIESELFGYEKGAFTGAQKSKKGMLEIADGGILFLDEIATMPISIQKKLLKAIEEKSFFPLGSEKSVHSDFRLVSATHENLKSKIEKGEFRADFFFRIEGFNVMLKSLRDRKQDLNKLIQFFVKKGERLIVFDSSAKIVMSEYLWPGNVRELERTIEVLQTRDRGIVTAGDLQILLSKGIPSNVKFDLEEVKRLGLKSYIENLETNILKLALETNEDKVRKTLLDLKISNNSFYRILDNLKARESERA
ncbi:MAG: sigma-54-dependent Fis family transcriptional regulator [Bacteriovorax sp.]|nr:sigma-54-dependent Fis family transcriptional regulator [Bacteriovorax sp.]